MVTSLLLIVFLFVLYFFAYSLDPREDKDKFLFSAKKISLYLIPSLCFLTLSSHLLAYILHSFRLAVLICFSLMIIFCIYSFLQQSSNKSISTTIFEERTTTFYIITLIISILVGFRGHISDSDNIHIAWISSMANNDFYPPVHPSDINSDFTWYHYGVDIVGAIIKILTNSSSWDSISIFISITSFAVLMSLFSIFSLYTKRKLYAAWASLGVYLYTSIGALEFIFRFYKAFSKANFKDILFSWQQATNVSSFHLSHLSVLPSQSISIASLISIFYIFNIFEKAKTTVTKIFLATLVISCSFVAFSSYPSYWYIAFAGYLGYALLKLVLNFVKKQDLNFFQNIVFVVLIFIGKLLTLKAEATNIHGINSLVFSPDLYWESFAMSYLYIFGMKFDNHIYRTMIDHSNGKIAPVIFLFSWMTFRTFGFLLITGIILAFANIKKTFDKSYTAFLSCFAGLGFPFIFIFVVKPGDTTRFLAGGRIFLLIFIAICVLKIIENKDYFFNSLFRSKYFAIPVLLCLSLINLSGLVSLSPIFGEGVGFNKHTATHALTKEAKRGLKEIEKYQNSGDIALSSEMFYGVMTDMTSNVGFYGVGGGSIYQTIQQTRVTATELMNPALIKELNAKYILVSKDKLNPLSIKRLEDKSWFEAIPSVEAANPNWRFYKFNLERSLSPSELENYQSEYKWVLGFETKGKLVLVKNEAGVAFEAQRRKELEPLVTDLKHSFAKQKNYVAAMWLAPIPIPTVTLTDLENQRKI